MEALLQVSSGQGNMSYIVNAAGILSHVRSR